MINGPQYWFKDFGYDKAKQEAKKFFRGKRCVVTGSDYKKKIDWHHLDENHSNNPLIGNLVPLSSSYNQQIDREKHPHGYPQDLTREHLVKAARDHWARGDYSLCYGVNRLGSFLAVSHARDPSTSIWFSTEALHCLRPLWETPLAVDTVARSIKCLITDQKIRSQISLNTLADLSKEMASWFLSGRSHSEFRKWSSLGDKLNSYTLSMNPHETSITSVRLTQHQGILLYQLGDINSARRQIIKADEIMRELSYSHGISNNFQYLARIDLISEEKKNLRIADDCVKKLEREYGKLEPVSTWYPGQTGIEFWTGLALMTLKAEVEHRCGHRERAEDLIYHVALLMKDKKIKTMEVFPMAQAIEAFILKYHRDQHIFRALKPFILVPLIHRVFYMVSQELYDSIKKLLLDRKITLSESVA